MAQNPLPDAGSVEFPAGTVPQIVGPRDEDKIVNALESYRLEAEQNRRSGPNPRDDKWDENLRLYWGRYDFSLKAAWQAKEVMPEVSTYVDRFAAAMKEALVSIPEGFYNVIDPADKDADMTQVIKRMTDVWLSRSGRNQMGQLLPFSAVFEEQMKLGALQACNAVVTWKDDVKDGRVAIETLDPKNTWLDHTYRNLYRVRKIELDRVDVQAMIQAKDKGGKSIFNLPEIERLIGGLQEDQNKREEMTGHGQQVSSGRSPIVLHEYIATVVDENGDKLADKSLCVVANSKYLIRGPEANPFWHGSDWLVYAPLVTFPTSVYGRSYMEDFGRVAETFNELTNMLLDAVHTSSLKAFVLVPGMLLNPEQATEGLKPNKTFLLEEGFRAEDFAKAMDLGTLPAESIKMWEMLKNELSEAASINEIGLGQFAPKGRTSATEIMETKQSSSALIRSVAQTAETRVLEPILDLTWKTGLQHVKRTDKIISSAAGEPMFEALWPLRKEMIARPITFQARGISTMIQRAQQLKALIGIVQMVGGNEILMQEFIKIISMEKFIKVLFELSGIDLSKFQMSERDQMIRSVTNPMNGGAGMPAEGGPAGMSRTMGMGG